jgi:hypothetical protein
MEGHSPASSFPFAINGPQWAIQVILVIWAENVSYRIKLIPCFLMSAALFLAIPFLSTLAPNPAYYSVFAMLFIFGIFNGTT